jgi:hypothetical protein
LTAPSEKKIGVLNDYVRNLLTWLFSDAFKIKKGTSYMRTTLGCLINFIVEISRLICTRPCSFFINNKLLPQEGINSMLNKVAKLINNSKVNTLKGGQNLKEGATIFEM